MSFYAMIFVARAAICGVITGIVDGPDHKQGGHLMSLKAKRLIIALLFFVAAMLSFASILKNGFSRNYLLYTLIFLGACILFIKNAVKP